MKSGEAVDKTLVPIDSGQPEDLHSEHTSLNKCTENSPNKYEDDDRSEVTSSSDVTNADTTNLFSQKQAIAEMVSDDVLVTSNTQSEEIYPSDINAVFSFQSPP